MLKFKIIFTFIFITLISTCNRQDTPYSSKESVNQSNSIFTKASKIIESKIDNPTSLMDEKVMNILQDSKGNYWFGTREKGVYKYDGKNITHFSKKDGLADDRIRGIQEDKFGSIYFDTGAGISQYDGQNFETLVLNNDSIDEWKLDTHDLWFEGYWGGNGAYRYDGQNLYHLEFPKHKLEKEFYKLNPNASFSPYEVYKIEKDNKGNIWFGTSILGACRFDGKSFFWVSEREMTEIDPGPAAGVRSILEDKDGNFWFNSNVNHKFKIIKNSTGNQNGKFSYEKIKGIDTSVVPRLNNYFMYVEQDEKGNIWMVRYDGGVWKYDGENLIHYPITFKNQDEDVLLFKMYKDKQGDLWLTTHNAGALKFNGETFESFKPFIDNTKE